MMKIKLIKKKYIECLENIIDWALKSPLPKLSPLRLPVNEIKNSPGVWHVPTLSHPVPYEY